ncbi:hypothetical protein DSM43276_00885 [Mycobacteroides salmoniphilum]|nr:hypothetical protein DSM43276_00885 [Mycobacteroides salmoniphilum]
MDHLVAVDAHEYEVIQGGVYLTGKVQWDHMVDVDVPGPEISVDFFEVESAYLTGNIAPRRSRLGDLGIAHFWIAFPRGDQTP